MWNAWLTVRWPPAAMTIPRAAPRRRAWWIAFSRAKVPHSIPFERYRKLTVGVNPDVAKKLGIILPQALLSQATLVTGGAKKDARPKRLALFVFSDSTLLELTASGILDELKQSGVLQKAQYDRRCEKRPE